MKWKNRRRSQNVEDRRGVKATGMALGGGTIVIIIIAMLFGADPMELLQAVETTAPPASRQQAERTVDAHEEELLGFVSVVLADTEDVWNNQFEQLGREYEEPILVVFSGEVQSACGFASAATGPFYCGADNHLYLDLSFLDELRTRFDAPGDFAGAYVVAHEVAHHVQNQLGILDEVNRERSRVDKVEANRLTVRLELQADFFAGVWAHHAQASLGVLEPGDIEEALGAANAIGDDHLQKEAQGYIVPDSFTHGTSEQRMRWFMRGYETGDIAEGDTFNAAVL